jgi:hypothetical protein
MAKTKSTQSRTSTRGAAVSTAVSEEERRRLIAEVAYMRAQARGFKGGDPMDDWLSAEREINKLLPGPQQQKQELAAYKKLRTSVEELLADAKDTLNADTIRQTLDDARKQMSQLGDYTADTIEKAIVTIEKEMLTAARQAGARLENLAERSTDVFAVWRDRGAQFLGRAATALRDWVQQASTRITEQTYHTGDIATGGTLECTACGGQVQLKTAAHVPLCPSCRKSEFRRLS